MTGADLGPNDTIQLPVAASLVTPPSSDSGNGNSRVSATEFVSVQTRSLIASTGEWLQEDAVGFRASDPTLCRYVEADALTVSGEVSLTGADRRAFLGLVKRLVVDKLRALLELAEALR
jgi:hypothetical protein